MRDHRLIISNGGFTLIEMVIVMAVFTVIIIITGKSFETVLKQTSIVSRSEESNIEGAIGLEILRHDLEQAGFGLYTDPVRDGATPPSFNEASATPASTYNDTATGIPRAIVAGDGNSATITGIVSGTDYLSIKGTTVARTDASQKWTYINGVGSSRVWGTNDLLTSEYVVVMKQNFSAGVLKRRLIYDPSSPSSFAVTYKTAAASYANPFGPTAANVQYYYYGVHSSNPRMPFNRTDYYVKRTSSDVTSSCSPGAGVLYKAVKNQTSSDGGFTEIPILDCVASMQVVFGWNTSGVTNEVDYYTDAYGTATSGAASPLYPVDFTDPSYIRQHLKLIKVYILAQDGGYDKNFVNTNTGMVVGDTDLGEAALTLPAVDLSSANYKNYRWKLYRVIVRPKNLI